MRKLSQFNRSDEQCPPGTGVVIGILCGLMFWVGVFVGVLF